MAWYALYKWFIPWRKTPYTNMISMYRRYLYDEWFNSLTDEEKERVLGYEKRKKEERRHNMASNILTMKYLIDTFYDRSKL